MKLLIKIHGVLGVVISVTEQEAEQSIQAPCGKYAFAAIYRFYVNSVGWKQNVKNPKMVRNV